MTEYEFSAAAAKWYCDKFGTHYMEPWAFITRYSYGLSEILVYGEYLKEIYGINYYNGGVNVKFLEDLFYKWIKNHQEKKERERKFKILFTPLTHACESCNMSHNSYTTLVDLLKR